MYEYSLDHLADGGEGQISGIAGGRLHKLAITAGRAAVSMIGDTSDNDDRYAKSGAHLRYGSAFHFHCRGV